MSLDKIKIQKTAASLIGHFDPKADLEVIADEDCQININTDFSGLLIGRHGDTLEALQYVLRLIIAKEMGEFVPVVVDVAGYRASREQEIEDQVLKAADRVLKFGGEEALSPMSSFERRKAHLILKDLTGVESESQGEEPYRRIVIRVKK